MAMRVIFKLLRVTDLNDPKLLTVKLGEHFTTEEGKLYFRPITGADILVSDPSNSDLQWSNISGRPTTLSGYGITDAVSRTTPIFDSNTPASFQKGATSDVNPVNANDLVIKSWVDTSLSNRLTDYKQVATVLVDVASVPSGVGTHNGVLVAVNNKVLITSSTLAQTLNGIYTVKAGVWTLDTITNTAGVTIVSVEGGTYKKSIFYIKNSAVNNETRCFVVNPTLNGSNNIIVSKSDINQDVIDLSDTGVAAGTYPKVTVDVKGRVTAASTKILQSDITFDAINTLSSFNINDAAPINNPIFTGQAKVSVDPIDNNDLTRKSWVQTLVDTAVSTGLKVLDPVKVATTANIPTLSGLLTVDTYTLVANDRVLVKNQTDPILNGLYLAQSGAWTRSLDADDNGEIDKNAFAFVQSGYVNAGSGWIVRDVVSVIGADPINWRQFAAGASYTFTGGLVQSGTSITLTNLFPTAKTFYKVTVDTKGRVTSGNEALVEADIPTLSKSKINFGAGNSASDFGIDLPAKVNAIAGLALTANKLICTVSDGGGGYTYGLTDVSTLGKSIISKSTPVEVKQDLKVVDRLNTVRLELNNTFLTTDLSSNPLTVSNVIYIISPADNGKTIVINNSSDDAEVPLGIFTKNIPASLLANPFITIVLNQFALPDNFICKIINNATNFGSNDVFPIRINGGTNDISGLGIDVNDEITIVKEGSNPLQIIKNANNTTVRSLNTSHNSVVATGVYDHEYSIPYNGIDVNTNSIKFNKSVTVTDGAAHFPRQVDGYSMFENSVELPNSTGQTASQDVVNHSNNVFLEENKSYIAYSGNLALLATSNITANTSLVTFSSSMVTLQTPLNIVLPYANYSEKIVAPAGLSTIINSNNSNHVYIVKPTLNDSKVLLKNTFSAPKYYDDPIEASLMANAEKNLSIDGIDNVAEITLNNLSPLRWAQVVTTTNTALSINDITIGFPTSNSGISSTYDNTYVTPSSSVDLSLNPTTLATFAIPDANIPKCIRSNSARYRTGLFNNFIEWGSSKNTALFTSAAANAVTTTSPRAFSVWFAMDVSRYPIGSYVSLMSNATGLDRFDLVVTSSNTGKLVLIKNNITIAESSVFSLETLVWDNFVVEIRHNSKVIFYRNGVVLSNPAIDSTLDLTTSFTYNSLISRPSTSGDKFISIWFGKWASYNIGRLDPSVKLNTPITYEAGKTVKLIDLIFKEAQSFIFDITNNIWLSSNWNTYSSSYTFVGKTSGTVSLGFGPSGTNVPRSFGNPRFTKRFRPFAFNGKQVITRLYKMPANGITINDGVYTDVGGPFTVKVLGKASHWKDAWIDLTQNAPPDLQVKIRGTTGHDISSEGINIAIVKLDDNQLASTGGNFELKYIIERDF